MTPPPRVPAIDRPPLRGEYRVDALACAVYAESAGVLQIVPRAVAIPGDPRDVCALMAWASGTGNPLVARGSGSSMSGAAVGDGIIVDLGELGDVRPIDRAWGSVWAGPAATRDAVDRQAREAQLRFPVDPSSGAFATIGGMTATNAAGARSLRHGAMRRWVRAIDCVFGDGTRAIIRRGGWNGERGEVAARWQAAAPGLRARAARLPPRRVRKESSGYGVHDFARTGELLDLLVGSEGTLALFVGVELSLIDVPVATASALVSWGSLDDAVRGAALAREGDASACELLDRTFLDVAAGGGVLPVPNESECVLLIELEGDSVDGVAARARALSVACRRAGALAVQVGLDPAAEHALWELRHAASPLLARLDPHIASMQIIEDGCVPPGELGRYVTGVRASLATRGVRGVIFGHAGDAHVHVNALVDVREAGWRERIRALHDDVVTLTARLHGTLSGEHGDGRLRTPFLHHVWSPDALALFADIKRVFDPAGVLNPGVKVPIPGVDPLHPNKYDPDVPPLPMAARHVLDRVAAGRRWHANRLQMLAEER